MPEPMYLSLQQAADYLGVSVTTIRNYISAGHLPGLRIRGVQTIRVKRADVDALLVPIPAARAEAS